MMISTRGEDKNARLAQGERDYEGFAQYDDQNGSPFRPQNDRLRKKNSL